MTTLAEGARFAGDYRIERPLRSGGMGTVYVAVQESTGKSRAIKVMRPELVANESLRKRFEQEAKVGAQIESEHVVEVQRAGIDAETGVPYLVMELLRGEDLGEAMAKRGSFPIADARVILEELCHAVAAAHDAGIVHRDLKPENVFLASTKRAGGAFTVKVLDFGIAKLAREASAGVTAAIGSPLWMAPEQTEAGAITTAADVWSIGLLAFQLLTGVSYWRAGDEGTLSVQQVLRAVLFDALPAASERAAQRNVVAFLPAGFDAWFSRCVVRDPAARFSTAREAYRALAPLLDSATQPAASAPRAVGPSPVAPTQSSGAETHFNVAEFTVPTPAPPTPPSPSAPISPPTLSPPEALASPSDPPPHRSLVRLAVVVVPVVVVAALAAAYAYRTVTRRDAVLATLEASPASPASAPPTALVDPVPSSASSAPLPSPDVPSATADPVAGPPDAAAPPHRRASAGSTTPATPASPEATPPTTEAGRAEDARKEARSHYKRAETKYAAHDFAGARAEFAAANAVLYAPSCVFQIARCDDALGNTAAAIKGYTEYLATHPRDADEVEARIAKLRGNP